MLNFLRSNGTETEEEKRRPLKSPWPVVRHLSSFTSRLPLSQSVHSRESLTFKPIEIIGRVINHARRVRGIPWLVNMSVARELWLPQHGQERRKKKSLQKKQDLHTFIPHYSSLKTLNVTMLKPTL